MGRGRRGQKRVAGRPRQGQGTRTYGGYSAKEHPAGVDLYLLFRAKPLHIRRVWETSLCK